MLRDREKIDKRAQRQSKIRAKNLSANEIPGHLAPFGHPWVFVHNVFLYCFVNPRAPAPLFTAPSNYFPHPWSLAIQHCLRFWISLPLDTSPISSRKFVLKYFPPLVTCPTFTTLQHFPHFFLHPCSLAPTCFLYPWHFPIFLQFGEPPHFFLHPGYLYPFSTPLRTSLLYFCVTISSVIYHENIPNSKTIHVRYVKLRYLTIFILEQ